MKRRRSAVHVNVLDLDPVCARALAHYNTEHTTAPATSVTSLRWAVVDTPEGLFAISEEGVGPALPVAPTRPLRLPLTATIGPSSDPDQYGSEVALEPALLSPDQLRALQSGDRQNLADFIGIFGARLERNYTEWDMLLSRLLSPRPEGGPNA